jgi:hypothetical protein
MSNVPHQEYFACDPCECGGHPDCPVCGLEAEIRQKESMKLAKDLRPGDMIIRHGKRYVIENVDKLDVDGKRYEIVATNNVMWFARWNTQYELIEES